MASCSTFVPPSKSSTLEAIMITPEVPPTFAKFLELGYRTSGKTDGLFPPIEEPEADDWLANFPTKPDPFQSWKSKHRNQITHSKRTIYILPIGKLNTSHPAEASAKPRSLQFMEQLQSYANAFFHPLPVILLPEVSLSDFKCKTRQHYVSRGVKRKQLLAGDIFKHMKQILPHDAYCMLGVTMVDLYPEESWNFVFGRASLVERIGVFSFARYHPNFFEPRMRVSVESLEELSLSEYHLMLWRAIKVLTHEIGHMFGMSHCVYFTCLMNGSNHAEESDRKLTFLCPVCLRKLQHAINFDFAERYKQMNDFFKLHITGHGGSEDSDSKLVGCHMWLQKALHVIAELKD